MKLLTVRELYELIIKNNGIVDTNGEEYIIKNRDNFYFGQYLLNYDITEIKFIGKIKIIDMPEFLFANFVNLEVIDVESWDVSDLVFIHRVFSRSNAKEIKCSTWNLKNCKTLCDLCKECPKLEKIDVSKWDVSNCEDIYNLFVDCPSLEKLDISNWKTPNLRQYIKIVINCPKLKNIDISNWYIRRF